MASIEDLYTEIAQIDDQLQSRVADTNSAEYWRETVELKTRQRDLWQKIADRVLGMDVPDWTRRAAFLAYDNCADKIYRYAECQRQCERRG
jgi:hypothetical protein